MLPSLAVEFFRITKMNFKTKTQTPTVTFFYFETTENMADM